MDYQKLNNETYDRAAKELAEYFDDIPARIEDIKRALTLANKPHNARVIEIGCGQGRDAAHLIPLVANYIGIDPSQGLLDIAYKKSPQGTFIQSTANDFSYPIGQDLIFSSASILHISKEDLRELFEKAAASLRTGGVFYISTKEAPEYSEEIRTDKHGDRMFYYYNVDLLTELTRTHFKKVYEDHQEFPTSGWKQWLTVAFEKIS